MKLRVHSRPVPGKSGFICIARLIDVTRDEHYLVYRHKMQNLNVAYDWDFGKFYDGRANTHCWLTPSRHQANLTIATVDKAFNETFLPFFERNRAAPKVAPTPPPQEITFSLDLIPDGLWPEHCHVFGESGGGKTQLLQSLVLHLSKQKVGFVVIDSQNEMLPLLKRKFPNAIHVDPSAADPPNLNIFDIPADPQDMGKLLDSFRFMFEAGEEPLTGPMATLFDKAIALMLVGYPAAYGKPASIEDLEDFLMGVTIKKEKMLSKRAKQAVDTMPQGQRRWYATEYPKFDVQCTSIHQRLQNICGEYKPFRRMLSNTSPPLNFRDAINTGGMVLINTHKDYLGKHASAFMGRYFVNLLNQQMLHRTLKSRRLFFVIDEVQQYLNENVVDLINETRKRNVCCVFAHQRLGQLPELLKDALGNVAITMATNIGRRDESEAMKIFNTTTTYELRDHKRDKETSPTSALYLLTTRGRAKSISFRLPFYQLEKMPEPDRSFDAEEHITISPKVAAKGGKVKIKDGYITIRPNTKNKQWYRVHGRGHINTKTGQRGNLYVCVSVPAHPKSQEQDTYDRP